MLVQAELTNEAPHSSRLHMDVASLCDRQDDEGLILRVTISPEGDAAASALEAV